MDLSITMASGILSNFEPKTEFNRVFSFHFTGRLTNFKIHKMLFGVITIVKDKTTTVDSAFLGLNLNILMFGNIWMTKI